MFWLTIAALCIGGIGIALILYSLKYDGSPNTGEGGIFLSVFGIITFILGSVLFLIDSLIRLYS